MSTDTTELRAIYPKPSVSASKTAPVLESSKTSQWDRIVRLVRVSLLGATLGATLFLGYEKASLCMVAFIHAFTVLSSSDWSKKRAWVNTGLVITELATTFCWPLMGLSVVLFDMSCRIIESSFKGKNLLDKIFAVVFAATSVGFFFTITMNSGALFVLTNICGIGGSLLGCVKELHKGHIFESFALAGLAILGIQTLRDLFASLHCLQCGGWKKLS